MYSVVILRNQFVYFLFSAEIENHIPGSKNIPFLSFFNEDGTFKSPDDIREGLYEHMVILAVLTHQILLLSGNCILW